MELLLFTLHKIRLRTDTLIILLVSVPILVTVLDIVFETTQIKKIH